MTKGCPSPDKKVAAWLKVMFNSASWRDMRDNVKPVAVG
jgi:hypothetical protein